MTAKNILLDEFIEILISIKNSSLGVERIDLDMVPDDSVPGMNKLVIHPQTPSDKTRVESDPHISIRNPQVNPEDDIQDLFRGLL